MTNTVDPSGAWAVNPDLALLAFAGSLPAPQPVGALAMQATGDPGASAWLDAAVARLVGTVKKRVDANTQTPLARLVRLHCQDTGRLVAQTWSAADGSYAFDRVPDGRYMVLSIDHEGQWAGVLEHDLVVQLKRPDNAHHTARLLPEVRVNNVLVFVRDRTQVPGGGGGGGGGGGF